MTHPIKKTLEQVPYFAFGFAIGIAVWKWKGDDEDIQKNLIGQAVVQIGMVFGYFYAHCQTQRDEQSSVKYLKSTVDSSKDPKPYNRLTFL